MTFSQQFSKTFPKALEYFIASNADICYTLYSALDFISIYHISAFALESCNKEGEYIQRTSSDTRGILKDGIDTLFYVGKGKCKLNFSMADLE